VPKYYRPSGLYPTVYAIPFRQYIKEHGIKVVIFDLDNTVFRHGSKKLSKQFRQLLAWLRKDGVVVGFASNHFRKRDQVNGFADFHIQPPTIGEFVFGARKPNTKFFDWILREARKICGEDLMPGEILVVGDSYLRDVNGALRHDMHGILVERLSWDPLFDIVLCLRLRESAILLAVHHIVWWPGIHCQYTET
jgi:predicted HAD superfamily phosphohydrolase YqeG